MNCCRALAASASFAGEPSNDTLFTKGISAHTTIPKESASSYEY